MRVSRALRWAGAWVVVAGLGAALMELGGFALLRRLGDPHLARLRQMQRFPGPPPDLTRFGGAARWVRDSVEVQPGVVLDGVVHVPNGADAPWLLYFGGNGGTALEGPMETFESLSAGRDWGFASWSYRGFGASTGTTTKQTLRQDSVRVAERLMAKWHVAPHRLRLFGFSLGTAPASHLAMVLSERGQPPAGAIFMATGWRHGLPLSLVYDPEQEVLRRRAARCPLLITHGAQDPVHRPQAALEDFRALHRADAEWLLVQAGHYHLDVPQVRKRVIDFIEHPEARGR